MPRTIIVPINLTFAADVVINIDDAEECCDASACGEPEPAGDTCRNAESPQSACHKANGKIAANHRLPLDELFRNAGVNVPAVAIIATLIKHGGPGYDVLRDLVLSAASLKKQAA